MGNTRTLSRWRILPPSRRELEGPRLAEHDGLLSSVYAEKTWEVAHNQGGHTPLNCGKHGGVGDRIGVVVGTPTATVLQEVKHYELPTHRRARIACWSEFRKWMPSQTRALITSMPVVAAVVAVIISVVVLARRAERAGGM